MWVIVETVGLLVAYTHLSTCSSLANEVISNHNLIAVHSDDGPTKCCIQQHIMLNSVQKNKNIKYPV